MNANLTATEQAGISNARAAYPAMAAVKLASLIANNPDTSLGAPTVLCTRGDILTELRRLDASQCAGTAAGN